MGRRAIIVFWGAVAAAVLFLGSAWSAFGRLTGPHAAANAAVFVVALIGFLLSGMVAGRIALVVGRTQRQARRALADGLAATGEGDG
jgi:uncharacterized membrane protein